MSDLKQEYLLSLYETENVISESINSEISIVMHTITKKEYICKKIKNGDSYHIYTQLKENSHRNLPVIEDVIVYDGNVYVIQEFVQGITLEQMLIKKKTLEKGKAISIMDQLCDALTFLHSLNPPIIHRDIKPSNLIIGTDGTVKLIDFDVARNYKPEMLKDTRLLGTEAYASPEQFGYSQTDMRSDIYSAGILFYEMLTGETNVNQNKLTRKLFVVVNKCTKLDPKERYQSAGELKKALHKGGKRALGLLALGLVVLVGVFFAVKFIDPMKSSPDITSTPIIENETPTVSKDALLTTAEETEQDAQGFSIDLQQFYEEDKYARYLLEDPYIDRKLKDTLGNNYDYFMESLQSINNVNYYSEDQAYFFDGGVSGLYTIMEASVAIYQSGEIECAYLYNDEIFYYSSLPASKRVMQCGVFFWMDKHEDNSLHVETDSIDIEGTYINPDNNNYVKIKKDDNGYFAELFGISGINIGGIEEYIQQTDINNWWYFSDEDYVRFMFTEDSVLVFEHGGFSGVGVILDGQYFKQ